MLEQWIIVAVQRDGEQSIRPSVGVPGITHFLSVKVWLRILVAKHSEPRVPRSGTVDEGESLGKKSPETPAKPPLCCRAFKVSVVNDDGKGRDYRSGVMREAERK